MPAARLVHQRGTMENLSAKNPGGVTITEMHGSTVADVDGDGVADFIVGKRYWSRIATVSRPNRPGHRCSTSTARFATRKRQAAASSSRNWSPINRVPATP